MRTASPNAWPWEVLFGQKGQEGQKGAKRTNELSCPFLPFLSFFAVKLLATPATAKKFSRPAKVQLRRASGRPADV
jgi:hypothetical protein